MEDNGYATNEQTGLIPQLVAVTAGFVQQLVEVGFGLARDVQAEMGVGISATIDWLEITQKTGFGIARRVHERASTLSVASLGAGETAMLALVGSARETSDGATRLVSHTATVLAKTPAYPVAN